MHLIFLVMMIALSGSPSFSKETADSQPVASEQLIIGDVRVVGDEQPTSSKVNSDEKKRHIDSIQETQEITHRIYTKDAEGKTTRITEIGYDILGEVVEKRTYLTSENIRRDRVAESYTSLKDSDVATESTPDVTIQVESSVSQYQKEKTVYTVSGQGELATDSSEPENNDYRERETEK